jgi:pimeloyl-ACP methyl ester carboxylesterase
MLNSPTTFINHRGTALHFSKYGKGSKVMLTFHGYGQDHKSWQYFNRSLGNDWTIYSFDLFFHGKSKWPNKDLPLTKKLWKEIIEKFLKEEQIAHFSLAGYSMGGKFVLATLEAFPELVKEITLIAPDGIKLSFWYRMVTTSSPMRLFFKSLIFQPSIFGLLSQKLGETRIVPQNIINFAQSQMSTRSKRAKVYLSWVVFRELRFNMKKIVALINFHHIKTAIFIGKYDTVIPEKRIRSFIKNLNHYQLEILQTGHGSLLNKAADFIKSQQ